MAGDFANLDSATIAQWPELNRIDPVTRSWYPAYGVTLTAVASLLLGARIWSQLRKSADGLSLHDGLICGAWMLATLLTASSLLGTLKYGFDKHMWDVSNTLYGHAALIQWLSEGAFSLSICLTKISVLCFHRKLETPCTRALKRIICAFIALTGCYSLASILTQLLLCRPIAAYWAIPKPHASTQRTCSSQKAYYLIFGLLGCFSTLYSIIIPFLILRNRPMSKSQRNGLHAISVAALSVLGAGIARTVFMFRFTSSENGDATWNGFNVFVCAQLECQLAITFASLPYLQSYVSQDPSAPIQFYSDGNKGRNSSVISRVSSSLSGQVKRLPLGRNNTPRKLDVSRPRPRAVQIPEWEFETLESPRHASSPMDEITYEQYVRGKFGPPAPPKDSREIFDQYRREHGEFV